MSDIEKVVEELLAERRELGLKRQLLSARANELRTTLGLSPKKTVSFYLDMAAKKGTQGSLFHQKLVELDAIADENHVVQERIKELKGAPKGFHVVFCDMAYKLLEHGEFLRLRQATQEELRKQLAHFLVSNQNQPTGEVG